MNKENVSYIQNGLLFSHKEEGNSSVSRKIYGIGDNHIKQKRPDCER
jgi:hypothetical protein